MANAFSDEYADSYPEPDGDAVPDPESHSRDFGDSGYAESDFIAHATAQCNAIAGHIPFAESLSNTIAVSQLFTFAYSHRAYTGADGHTFDYGYSQ